MSFFAERQHKAPVVSAKQHCKASGARRRRAWEAPFFTVTPAAAVFYPLLFLFLTDGELTALLSATAVHESGHLLALGLCGASPTGIRLGLFGLSIGTQTPDTPGKEAFCALSGPLAGLLWAVFLPSGEWTEQSAAISALLSIFNLLPVYPLDGAKALYALGMPAKGLRRCGSVCALALSVLALLCRALPAAGCALWLLRSALRGDSVR